MYITDGLPSNQISLFYFIFTYIYSVTSNIWNIKDKVKIFYDKKGNIK